MVGSLAVDGAAYPDARVEICVESLYSNFYGDTPCSDQPLFFQTTTNADGIFSFADVPPGLYVLVAETADGWAQLTNDFGIGSEMIPVFKCCVCVCVCVALPVLGSVSIASPAARCGPWLLGEEPEDLSSSMDAAV